MNKMKTLCRAFIVCRSTHKQHGGKTIFQKKRCWLHYGNRKNLTNETLFSSLPLYHSSDILTSRYGIQNTFCFWTGGEKVSGKRNYRRTFFLLVLCLRRVYLQEVGNIITFKFLLNRISRQRMNPLKVGIRVDKYVNLKLERLVEILGFIVCAYFAYMTWNKIDASFTGGINGKMNLI